MLEDINNSKDDKASAPGYDGRQSFYKLVGIIIDNSYIAMRSHDYNAWFRELRMIFNMFDAWISTNGRKEIKVIMDKVKGNLNILSNNNSTSEMGIVYVLIEDQLFDLQNTLIKNTKHMWLPSSEGSSDNFDVTEIFRS
jgi:hypothetical protein